MGLFDTTEQLQDYVSVTSDLSLQTLKPFFTLAELKYIFPIIGREVWKNVIENNSGEGYELIVEQARFTLANLAISLYIQNGGAMIGNEGIFFSKTDNMWRLSDRDKADMRAQFYDAGMMSLDMLLETLDAESTAGYKTIWENSSQAKRFQSLLIRSALAFDKIVQTFHSRVTFASMHDVFMHVQYMKIVPVASGFFEALLAIDPDNEESEAKKQIKQVACSALALLAVAKALRIGTYERTEFGFQVVGAKVNNPSDQIYEYETDGQAALEELRRLLEEHLPDGYVALLKSSDDGYFSTNSGIVVA